MYSFTYAINVLETRQNKTPTTRECLFLHPVYRKQRPKVEVIIFPDSFAWNFRFRWLVGHLGDFSTGVTIAFEVALFRIAKSKRNHPKSLEMVSFSQRNASPNGFLSSIELVSGIVYAVLLPIVFVWWNLKILLQNL